MVMFVGVMVIAFHLHAHFLPNTSPPSLSPTPFPSYLLSSPYKTLKPYSSIICYTYYFESHYYYYSCYPYYPYCRRERTRT